MNAKDMIHLLEYAKAFNPPQRTPRRDRRFVVKQDKEPDPLEVMMRWKRMSDEFSKFQSDLEKINKKEEKKDDKKKESWWDKLTGMQKFTVILAVTPFITVLELLPVILIIRVFAP